MKRADGEGNDKNTCREVVKDGSTTKRSDVKVIDIKIDEFLKDKLSIRDSKH